jgi:RNA polymerase sigma-B factor
VKGVQVALKKEDVSTEETKLWEDFLETKSPHSRALLISQHLNLVQNLAKRFLPRAHGEPLEDLVQVGVMGLIKAIDHYDPSKDVQFKTYAIHQVTGEIRHYLRDKVNLIRHPRWLGYLTFQVNNEAEKLAQKLGRQPTTKEIADSLNITEEGVLEVFRLNEILTNTSFNEEDLEYRFENAQRKIQSQRLVSFQLPIEDKIVLLNAMEKLVELERKAIYLFFYYDLTQGEIGEKLGLTQRTVSRLIQKGLSKLKDILTVEL